MTWQIVREHHPQMLNMPNRSIGRAKSATRIHWIEYLRTTAIQELHRKTEGNGQSLINARHLVGRQPTDARFQAALVN
jgi:hypothetical protein